MPLEAKVQAKTTSPIKVTDTDLPIVVEPAEEQNKRSAHYGRGLPIMAGGWPLWQGVVVGGGGVGNSFMCRMSHIRLDEGVKHPLPCDIYVALKIIINSTLSNVDTT